MSTPALLPLRLFAIIAIAARSLVVDVLEILASISAANVAARRASGVFDIGQGAQTAETIGEAALTIIGPKRSAEEAAVVLATEALLACRTLREMCGEYVHGASYQHVLEAVAEVELAARFAPAGASAEDITRGRWTGPRYVPHRETADLAADLRRDLAAAATTAGALRGVRCRVRCTGYMALQVEVVAVPDHAILLNPARVAAEMANPHAHTGLSWQSARGLAVDVAVTRAANAYSMRRDRSTALHVEVIFAKDLRAAQRAEIEAVVRLATAAA